MTNSTWHFPVSIDDIATCKSTHINLRGVALDLCDHHLHLVPYYCTHVKIEMADKLMDVAGLLRLRSPQLVSLINWRCLQYNASLLALMERTDVDLWGCWQLRGYLPSLKREYESLLSCLSPSYAAVTRRSNA